MFRQIRVIDQLQTLEVRDLERCRLACGLRVVLVLALLRSGGKLAAKRLDEMRPILLDVGAQIEVARLQQPFAR